jgi:hypothetical protein
MHRDFVDTRRLTTRGSADAAATFGGWARWSGRCMRGRRLEMQRPATPDAEIVARRAHEIWEQEGRPEGRHQEHWQTAERELTAGPEDDAGPEPVAGDEDAAAPAGTPL